MARQYRSDVMASIHETAENLHAAGAMDRRTLRRFDEACLTPVRSLTAAEIKALRDREGASQAVFARYLNAGPLPQAAFAGRSRRPRRRRLSASRWLHPVAVRFKAAGRRRPAGFRR